MLPVGWGKMSETRYCHTCPKHGVEDCRCRGYLWHECTKGDKEIVDHGFHGGREIWSHTWREQRKKALASVEDPAQTRL